MRKSILCRAVLPLALLGFCLVAGAGGLNAAPYDPLSVPAAGNEPVPVDLTVHGAARGRDVPVRVYLPAERTAAPVVLFSHGLGGSRAGSAFLGRHWAARGYAAVFLQHPGSDEAVWRNVPPAEGLAAMRKAVNLQNYEARIKDVSATLDQLADWQQAKGNPLEGRMDLSRMGMSGHSFGAWTTQAVSGQLPVLGQPATDARIKAAVIMSPAFPRIGGADRAFGQVKIPWLLLTGTKDLPLFGLADAASRLKVYPALPPGGKYELVLDRAEHSVFIEHALPGDTEARNPNHQRAILAVTTAFWDAYLRGDEAARTWLDGEGPRSVLEPADRWQRK